MMFFLRMCHFRFQNSSSKILLPANKNQSIILKIKNKQDIPILFADILQSVYISTDSNILYRIPAKL